MTFSAGPSFLLMVLLVSTAIAVYMIWLAWKRPNRQRLTWRILASLAAIICLALMALQPTIRQPVSSQAAMLITEGASADRVQTLLKSQPGLPVYALNNLPAVRNVSAQPIPDVAYLRRNFPQVSQLHVLGYGLPEFVLRQLDSVQITWHPAGLPAGLQHIHWTEKVKSGEPLRVQGNYQNDSDSTVKLILAGFGLPLDSVSIARRQSLNFQLQTTPKEVGRFVYKLRIRLGNDTLREEKIPVEVLPASPLQVLALESFPNFETKFLKNWLAGQQHRVAVRSEISKNKFRTDFLNAERIKLNRLSPALLSRFDVLLTDHETFRQLNTRETAAIQQAVEKTGLGVLIQVVAPVRNIGKPGSFTSGFSLQPQPDVDFLRVVPKWQNAPENLTATNITPAELLPNPAHQLLVTDQSGRILMTVAQQGAGKIAASLLVNTYTWALEGNPQYHAAYWTFLLGQLARQQTVNEQWKIATPFPVVDQPVTVSLQTNQTQLPVATLQNVNVYLQQNQADGSEWQGTFWPRNEGWQQTSANGKPFWWYAFGENDWPDLQRRQRTLATRQFIMQQSASDKADTNQASAIFRPEPVSLLWFFLGFLLSSGYLWLERKL